MKKELKSAKASWLNSTDCFALKNPRIENMMKPTAVLTRNLKATAIEEYSIKKPFPLLLPSVCIMPKESPREVSARAKDASHISPLSKPFNSGFKNE